MTPASRQLWADPDDSRHGTNAGYSAKCRCPRCTAAHAETSRTYDAAHREVRRRTKYRSWTRSKAPPPPPLNVSPYDLLMWAAEEAA